MKKYVIACAFALTATSVNATVLYNDRTIFEGTLGTSIVDDYENPAYAFNNTNAEMSAVLGETTYETTGFDNWNLVTNITGDDHAYCAGCNGSFLLDFNSTSVSETGGVYGVGFDVHSAESVRGSTAFVTFGDGTTENYTLADASDMDYFWGITSELLISTIHFGLVDGGVNTSGTQRMSLDDLTIGNEAGSNAVPAPASLLLLGIGLLGLAASRKKA